MKIKYYLITALILVADHIAKWIAWTKLQAIDDFQSKTLEIIPGYLRLSYMENRGVAWGILDKVEFVGKPYLLGGLAIVAVVVIVIYSMHVSQNRKLLHLALAITIGGILGNFFDRVIRGYVIDFIQFHIKEVFDWPTFNIADSAITIGIILLLIDTIRNPVLEEEKQSVVGGR
jgi:signal peptidase II